MHDRSRGRGRSRGAGLLVAALMTMVGGSALAGSRVVEVENVRVGFQERYKVGNWTPAWVQLRGGVDGFKGYLVVTTQDESGVPTSTSQYVQVAPGAAQRVTCYIRPGSLDPDFATLRFIDEKTGRRAIPEDVVIGNIVGSKSFDSLGQGDYQVVSFGRSAGVEMIPDLPGLNRKSANNAVNGSNAREVSVANLKAADDLIPGRWYGYDSVDVVVIDTNDKEILATLGGRVEALKQWVRHGGHLAIAVSSNWQAINDSPLAEMLPLKVNGQIQVSPFDSLESFTGGSHQVTFENAPTQVARFEEIEARGGKVIASTLSTPLVVRGSYGFGRVTVIGLDVDTKPFASWPDRGLFFVKALDLKPANVGANPNQVVGGPIFNNNVHDLSTVIRRALDKFEGVTLIPFAWVAGFIVLYILLIGPGDYFFLKKVLKRMELTWITFPTIVITVSLLAYYAAYVVKGTDLRVNKIDVVDVDLVSKQARGSTWVNLFSPVNRDYNVKIVPILPDKEPPADPKAEVAAPAGSEVLLSWFATPENGLRGMNNRGQGIGFGGGGYRYEPMGKAEELEGVRVAIWSTKSFMGRWFGPAPADGKVLDVDLAPVGPDRLAGTITNRLPVALKNTIVIFGKQVYYDVATIEPGATVDIETKLNRALAPFLQEKRARYLPVNYWDQNSPVDRPDLIRQMMFHDSDPTNQDVIPNRMHHDLDLTGLLALDRPMLVAEIDRPGTHLELPGTSAEAKTDQVTLLRVLLPLKKEGEPGRPK